MGEYGDLVHQGTGSLLPHGFAPGPSRPRGTSPLDCVAGQANRTLWLLVFEGVGEDDPVADFRTTSR